MEKSSNNFFLDKLALTYTGIGSLPFCSNNAPDEANNFVFNTCGNFPFWAQLPHYKMEENMIFQFIDGLAGLSLDKRLHRFYLDDKKEDFLKNLDTFLCDYETITSSNSLFDFENILNKYSLKPPYSNTFGLFLKTLEKKEAKPNFIKGTITGAYTILGNFCDREGKPAIFNKTFIDIIPKFLTLKALFQIKEFKKAQNEAIPVIFIDEPRLSQINSYPYNELGKEKIISILKLISDNIKKFDAISGLHCCGATNWEIAAKSGVNIISFDAYFYSENISRYSKEIETFLKNGGFLALGIIPTLDKEALLSLDKDKLYKKFQNSIDILSKNIDKNLILNQCFITPSCGLGSLDINLAHHAMNLAKELSKTLKEENGVKL